MVDLVIKETGLETQYLKLEMTESLFLKNTEKIIERLHLLKALGLQLSIDDFGEYGMKGCIFWLEGKITDTGRIWGQRRSSF